MYKVYYTSAGGLELADSFGSTEMTKALNHMQFLRSVGCTFVTMASESAELVGSMGVNAVKDGKLPDGSDYDWTKNDRVGAAFKSPE